MNNHSSKRRFLITAAAVAVAGLTLSGCSLLPSAAPERDADTNEVVQGGTESAFSMQVGDCFNDESGTDGISSVPMVPCSEPHDNEVVYVANLEGSEYPGDDAVYDQSLQMCVDQFASIVGIDYESSSLDVYPIYPSEDTWTQMDDREVVCSLWDPAGQSTGTLVGAAR